jgi:hypothetical protein
LKSACAVLAWSILVVLVAVAAIRFQKKVA